MLTDVFELNVELVGLLSSFFITFFKIILPPDHFLKQYYCLINFISCLKGTKEKRILLKTTALEISDSLCLSKPFLFRTAIP